MKNPFSKKGRAAQLHAVSAPTSEAPTAPPAPTPPAPVEPANAPPAGAREDFRIVGNDAEELRRLDAQLGSCLLTLGRAYLNVLQGKEPPLAATLHAKEANDAEERYRLRLHQIGEKYGVPWSDGRPWTYDPPTQIVWAPRRKSNGARAEVPTASPPIAAPPPAASTPAPEAPLQA